MIAAYRLGVLCLGALLSVSAPSVVSLPAQETMPTAEAPEQRVTLPDTLTRVQRTQLDSAYIAVLEKTNTQLSYWFNPLGVAVGALAVLITALTIMAAVLLWRQSREFKATLNAAVEKYDQTVEEIRARNESVIEAFLEDKTSQLEEMQSRLPEGADAEELTRTIDSVLKQYALLQGELASLRSSRVSDDVRKEEYIIKSSGINAVRAAKRTVKLPAPFETTLRVRQVGPKLGEISGPVSVAPSEDKPEGKSFSIRVLFSPTMPEKYVVDLLRRALVDGYEGRQTLSYPE